MRKNPGSAPLSVVSRPDDATAASLPAPVSAAPAPQELLAAAHAGLDAALAELSPWFVRNMPEYYFRTHAREDVVRHLHAVVLSKVSGEHQTLLLKSPCGTCHTVILPGIWVKNLLDVLDNYATRSLAAMRVVSSRDETLRLCDLVLAPQPAAESDSRGFAAALADVDRAGLLAPGEREAFREFLAGATADYVAKFDAARAVRHFRAYGRVVGRDAAEATLENEVQPGIDRVTVTMMYPPDKGLLSRMVRALARQAADIDRVYADLVQTGDGPAFFASFYVRCRDSCLRPDSPAWSDLRDDLRRSKWRPQQPFEALAATAGVTSDAADVLHAAASFAHTMLARLDPHAFSWETVVEAVLSQPVAARAVWEEFDARFRPRLPARDQAEADVAARVEALLQAVEDPTYLRIFARMRSFTARVLRTNAYMPDRFGLAFRLDPAILDEAIGGETPYGLYFFHGPGAIGFHIRFREMARGGLRIVRADSASRFEAEAGRLFDEAARLARTQQDKNKDIPEGGAKGVLLVGPQGDERLALQSAVDGFLDCIAWPESGPDPKLVADRLGAPEIIFLGPDEHITPEYIDWIVSRARKRGYAWPEAFMSSKAETGINHKEFGVTSRGVLVFVEEALKHLGIDPAGQDFSVKLTGGPRGDVAGNLMRLFIGRYGERARILAVSDGSGGALDPDGLDQAELMRLIEAELPIAAFAPDRLRGKEAFVVRADTPEGARTRTDLHNRVAADVFVPAGGRPDTMNAHNWRNFLDATGKPSARTVVEGANIFLSLPARDALEKHGVMVIPGASANKTGVISSSYEILAGLTLSPEEFLAIRERFIAELLDILEVRARDEARLLMREHSLSGGRTTLTRISARIAKEINDLADRIRAELEARETVVGEDPDLAAILLDYCPAVLRERYADRLFARLPRGHQNALVAHASAARIVYAEGLGWLRRLAGVRDIIAVVRAYVAEAKVVEGLSERLGAMAPEDRAVVLRVLSGAGRKLLTLERLGL